MLENKYTVFNIREYLKSENHGQAVDVFKHLLADVINDGLTRQL